MQNLSDQIQEYNSVKERLTEQQEVIVDLESKLKERNDTLQHDKHKYVSEIKHLRNEVSSVIRYVPHVVLPLSTRWIIIRFWETAHLPVP